MNFYQEGYDAAQRGISFFRCPYRPLTAGFTYWIRGWKEAKNMIGEVQYVI